MEELSITLQRVFKIALVALTALTLTLFFGGRLHAQPPDDLKLRVFVHEVPPHGPDREPVLSSSCTVTTNDTVNDYGLTGWHLPAGGINYKISYGAKPSSLTNDQVTQAVQGAFATWHAADPDKTYTLVGDSGTTRNGLDFQNVVGWKRLSPSTIGVTYVWYYTSTGQIADVDTMLNSRFPWSYTPYSTDCGGVAGTFDLGDIFTHESGHWNGLDDLLNSVDQDLTMYGYGTAKELKKDTLGTGDITGVNAVSP